MSVSGMYLRTGIFTLIGIVLFLIFSFSISQKKMWWKKCNLVMLYLDDATGIKPRSSVKSLGVQIGYIHSVSLKSDHVVIGVCLTAPVAVNPDTKANIRSEGFLGDKFIELKPVESLIESSIKNLLIYPFVILANIFFPLAYADNLIEAPKISVEKQKDFDHLVSKVDSIVEEVNRVATNLHEAIDPAVIRQAINNLNTAIANISNTVSPKSGLSQTARRSLAKLEDTIEKIQSIVTRINNGEGSIGRLINDPKIAQDIQEVLEKLKNLLDRLANVQIVIDLQSSYLTSYKQARSGLSLAIWPRPDRYYLIGVGVDPRGRYIQYYTTTTVNGVSQSVQTGTYSPSDLLFSFMLGKVYHRFNFSAGLLYGYGTVSGSIACGPQNAMDRIQIRTDAYYIKKLDMRFSAQFFLYQGIYVKFGLESIYQHPVTKNMVFHVGGGLSFTDDDIKLLFALK